MTSLDDRTIPSRAAVLDYDMPTNDPFSNLNHAGLFLKELPFVHTLDWNPETSAMIDIPGIFTTGVAEAQLRRKVEQKSFLCVEPGCLRAFSRQSALR